MTTKEAARYLGKSVSFILHRADVPYLPGRPNMYKRSDLDAWFDQHKHNPLS